MNCASTDRARRRARGSSGYTMLEMLLAVAILSIFISGIYATFVKISQARQNASARLEAVRNGRAALQSISDELKALGDLGGAGLLISPDTPTQAFGDGIDNDGNGQVDEGVVDGQLDAGTSATVVLAGDRHAELATAGPLYERPERVGVPDLGDAGVDVDVKFGNDIIVFNETPAAPSNIQLKVVTYAIPPEGYEGIPNVLVRKTRIESTDPSNPTGPPLVSGGTAPIAFGVLGFDLLFWDSNAAPAEQRWLTSWDSTAHTGDKFRLPASVYVRLTLRADPRPTDVTPAGAPVQTVVLQTVADVESVIGSPLFERPVLP